MPHLRFALSLGAIALFVAAAVIHPPVRELLLLASLLLTGEAVLALRALRELRAAVTDLAEEHLGVILVADQVQMLAAGATTEEAIAALDTMVANPGMARGLAKVIMDMAAKVMEAKATAGKGASGD